MRGFSFEVGVVYRSKRTGGVLIAADHDALITARRGVTRVIRPYSREGYEAVRTISVATLCMLWEVEAEVLDEAMRAVLGARKPEKRKRPDYWADKRADPRPAPIEEKAQTRHAWMSRPRASQTKAAS